MQKKKILLVGLQAKLNAAAVQPAAYFYASTLLVKLKMILRKDLLVCLQ